MAKLRNMSAAITLALALTASASNAQQRGSVSLTHTVVVTVPPRVRVQVAPTQNQLQPETAKAGLAVTVRATTDWTLGIGSKKTSVTRWVDRNSEASSMVVYRNTASQRTPGLGGASDSEPVMLTVVAP
jgi:hypothetical protein